MKRILEKLAELEKLVDVPNVDKQPNESLKEMQMLNLIVEIRGLVKELEGEDVPEEFKGNSWRYSFLMERLIERQKEMDPEWFKAHAFSIVLRAYSRGMDDALIIFKKIGKALKGNSHAVLTSKQK